MAWRWMIDIWAQADSHGRVFDGRNTTESCKEDAHSGPEALQDCFTRLTPAKTTGKQKQYKNSVK